MTNSPADNQIAELKRRIDDSLAELNSGQTRSVAILRPETSEVRIGESSGADLHPRLIVPGAFNPLHEGHLQMARFAESLTGYPAWFELSIQNVDKPVAEIESIRHRLLRSVTKNQIPAEDGLTTHSFHPHGVLLTNLPTFEEKSALFPDCVFAVGVDTLIRIADVRYYHNSHSQRDGALHQIAELGCRFLVFGRVLSGRFVDLFHFNVPERLLAICDQVPESQFRSDVSSSKIREQ